MRIEDVLEPQLDEAGGGLMPAWIQPDIAGISRKLERALCTACGEKSQRRDHLHAKARHGRMNREP